MAVVLSGCEVIQDWAIIVELRADELLVQISREVLPASVQVAVGSILGASI